MASLIDHSTVVEQNILVPYQGGGQVASGRL